MPPDHETAPEAAEQSDLQLIARTRTGDADAYAVLFARHRDLALGVARGLGGPDLADDLVAESFARILALLQEGKGPQRTFGAYLKVTLRSVYVDHVRRDSRLQLAGDATDLPDLPDLVDPTEARVEASLVTRAFAGLPPRSQMVLWLSEVDGVPPAEIGELMGLSTNAVGQLAFRARESLRQGYLASHLGAVVHPECQEVGELLPAYVRGTQTVRRVDRVDRHVADCARCALALAELQAVESQLRALLLPILPPTARGIGVSAGAGAGDPLPVAPAVIVPVGRFAGARPGPGLVAATVVGLGMSLAASMVLRVADDDATAASPDVPVTVDSPRSVAHVFGVAPRLAPGSAIPAPTDSPSDSPTDLPTLQPTPGGSPSATGTGEPIIVGSGSGSADDDHRSASSEEPDPSPSESDDQPTPPPDSPPNDPKADVSVIALGAKMISQGENLPQWSVEFALKGAGPGVIAQLVVRGDGALIDNVADGGWKCSPTKASVVVCEAGAEVSRLGLLVTAPVGSVVTIGLRQTPGDPDRSNDSASITLNGGTGAP